MNDMNISLFNDYLIQQQKQFIDPKLNESMLYSLKAGGKRIRPLLIFYTLDLFGIDRTKGYDYAAAIEMIHTYSLIHDDLPSMDDDDYRRGKLTNHKVYGEATAILAGDALLTDSFGVIANSKEYSNKIKIDLISLLSKRAGSNGMVGGQMLDMNSEDKCLTEIEMKNVHAHKTGDLITACIIGAGYIANSDVKTIEKLNDIGDNIGLMFQIKDDLLDVEGDFESLGKPVGSDISNHKSTYVSIHGINQAKEILDQIYQHTIELIDDIQKNAGLKELVTYIVNRNN